jgi:hypothetical protein
VLILRAAAGFSARETATLLGTSVQGALERPGPNEQQSGVLLDDDGRRLAGEQSRRRRGFHCVYVNWCVVDVPPLVIVSSPWAPV